MVVIPADEAHVAGDLLFHFFRMIIRMLVYLPVGGTHEHISPHLAGKAVFCGDLQHPFEVPLHDALAFLRAVDRLVFSPAQPECLVHADVDQAGSKILRERTEHVVDQPVRALFSHQQNILDIADGGVLRIAENRAQMRERLDTGNQLDAACGGVCVHLLQLRARISAAQIAEVWLALHLVSILRIKPDRVVSQRG